LKFRKINETTINCIITQDDLKKHGINLDDLFDRKKNAVEFIRGVILKAANSVNLSMKNDYTSMRISVIPDHSVSLTISQDPAVSA
jgi:adapter protein MecA 1/2